MRPLTFSEKLRFVLNAPLQSSAYARAQYQSPIDIRRLQNDRFLRLVRHAYETVPFYRKKYDEAGVRIDKLRTIDDIKELPVVEKEELIKGFPQEVLSSAYSQRKDLFLLVTGGTTGHTMRILHSPDTIFASFLSYHRAYACMMKAGYHPYHVCSYVYTCPYPFESFFGAYPMRFICTLDPAEVIRSKLLEAKPHLLTGYPSTLQRVSKSLSLKDIEILRRRLQVISVNSEMSSQAERDDLAELWGVPVLDEFCSEEISTVMFYQCRSRTYHIQEDLCVVESVDSSGAPLPDGHEGDLVVTGLLNYAMPFIRYNQGDRIALENSSVTCPCGVTFKHLCSVKGRANDAFHFKSGKTFDSGFLLDVGYTTLDKYSHFIDFWALVQESLEKVVLELGLRPGKEGAPLDQIERDIANLFRGEAKAEVRIIDPKSRPIGGKRRQIVSKVRSSRGEIVPLRMSA